MFGCLLLGVCLVSEPAPRGLQVGDKWAPYAAVVATGPERGTRHCYVCAAADRPAIVVFARGLSAELGTLAAALDGELVTRRGAGLTAWITLLSNDPSRLEPEVVVWAKPLRLRQLPIGIFEDDAGPPAYRLDRATEINVLLVRGGQVRAAFAGQAADWQPGQLAELKTKIAELCK